jgi:hypothetical protein
MANNVIKINPKTPDTYRKREDLELSW